MSLRLQQILRLMSGEELLLLRILWGGTLRPAVDRELDYRASINPAFSDNLLDERIAMLMVRVTPEKCTSPAAPSFGKQAAVSVHPDQIAP